MRTIKIKEPQMKMGKTHSMIKLESPYTLEEYKKFLSNKIDIVEWQGFEVEASDLHWSTKPHQASAIKWCLKIGRGLLAKSFGLGKTHDQIEIAKQVIKREGGQFLVVCPLGVKHQFMHEDGPRLDIEFDFVQTDLQVKKSQSPFLITNYESLREGKIIPDNHNLSGVTLDEGSVLRSLGSKTYQEFMSIFDKTTYRWVCTATPSPNNFKEILGYADFLGVMDRGQALTRFFMRNPDKAGDLRLIPHREDQFWLWVASWALFIYKPSDLGFSDEGYELPKLHINWHKLPVDHTRAFEQVDSWGQHKMFLDAAGGIGPAMIEKRATIDERVAKTQEIIAKNPNDHYILWHDLEDERKAISKAIPKSTSVYGSQPLEVREQNILDFSHGEFPILSTKPQIAGSGCNFQYHCHRAIFIGIGYKFQDFIQAIHRVWRFQQVKEVYIDIIYVESEESIQKVLLSKWKNHDKLVTKMQKIIKKNGLTHLSIENALKRHISFERDEHIGKGGLFRISNTDSVLELYDLVNAMEKGQTNPMTIKIGEKT